MPTTVSTDSAKRALLEHLIDDAGLFPPTSLSMDRALRAHARHGESAYAWIGGPFVVPASRLVELTAARDAPAPTLSVILDAALAAKGDTVRADLDRVARAGLGNATIASFELKTRTPLDAAGLTRALTTIAESHPAADLTVYYEVPYANGWTVPPADTFAVLAAARDAAPNGPRLGAKLRCGGTAPATTPSIEDVAAFVVAAQAHGIPWKATAGLHHPVRGIHHGTLMHGFLNLFIAAVALHAGALGAARVAEVIAEQDPRAFLVDPMHVGWRDIRVDAEAVAAARAHAVSFGSCSFDEPVNDLRELGLLL